MYAKPQKGSWSVQASLNIWQKKATLEGSHFQRLYFYDESAFYDTNAKGYCYALKYTQYTHAHTQSHQVLRNLMGFVHHRCFAINVVRYILQELGNAQRHIPVVPTVSDEESPESESSLKPSVSSPVFDCLAWRAKPKMVSHNMVLLSYRDSFVKK